MTNREQLDKLINSRLKHLLLVAQTAIPEGQFLAYRKIVLDEFGNNGLGKDLDKLFSTTMDRQGTGRNILRKGRGAS